MEDSREGEGDDEKKGVECQVHTWMREKGKKAMIYKARKDRKVGGSEIGGEKDRKRKIRSLGHVRRGLRVRYHVRTLDIFYTKTQYFGPRSD